MKVITIENSEDFSLLYQGFIVGGNSFDKKTMQIIRREAKILDKLEALSEPIGDDRYPTGDRVRKLIGDKASLTLTPEEYELFKNYFESVNWTTRLSREVVRLADLIENAA